MRTLRSSRVRARIHRCRVVSIVEVCVTEETSGWLAFCHETTAVAIVVLEHVGFVVETVIAEELARNCRAQRGNCLNDARVECWLLRDARLPLVLFSLQ